MTALDVAEKRAVLKDLQRIPGIGKSLAEDLYNLGYRSVAALKDQNPQAMYLQSCDQAGVRLDPCVLYTYRCAVYFASNTNHEPDLLKWWNWRTRQYPTEQ